jgi:hypothetical protein
MYSLEQVLKIVEALTSKEQNDNSALKCADTLAAGEYVIVRCSDAGVHAGELVGYEGRTVHLRNARRLWRWHANQGISLSDVAVHGIDPSKSRVSVPVKSITLLEACEIISTDELGYKSIIVAPASEKS